MKRIIMAALLCIFFLSACTPTVTVKDESSTKKKSDMLHEELKEEEAIKR